MLVQDFKTQAQEIAKKHFPHSVITFWNGISGDSLCISFAACDKDNCPNKIQHNAPMLFHVWMHDSIDPKTGNFNAEKIKMDGYKISLSIKTTQQYYAMGHDRFTVRARVNTPEKILKCFDDSLKKASIMWNKHLDDGTFYRPEHYTGEILNQCR